MWWALLFLVFIADATITLLRRAVRRRPVFSAHRQHAYQRAVGCGYSHRSTFLTVTMVNVVLGGIATAGIAKPDLAPVLMAIGGLLVMGLYVAVERKCPMFARSG
jgi:Fuc2NAc and GlcNAc transferase